MPEGGDVPASRNLLREVLAVEQTNPSLRRRWFESDYFDLITWQDLTGVFTKFQLCYDVELNERALVWDRHEGFSHDRVDLGRMSAPELIEDGRFDSGTVVPRFEREAASIPVEVRDFVLARIREHLIKSRRRKVARRSRARRLTARRT